MKTANRIKISDQFIGVDYPPFIIAEMSGNHNHSLERALEIVEAAAVSGVHAIKLQTYTPDTITLDCKKDEFMIRDDESIWKGQSLYELYQKAYTPWEWHEPIMKRAKELGLICFSSPFDDTAIDFLEEQNVPAYKIASFENIDLPLIKKVASTQKPLIISTGMASIAELDELVSTARENGCKELILLKCSSTYPASPANSNLRTIPHLKELFNTEVGLSDHTLGIGAAIASVSLGATVIEKHFTLNRAEGGVDSAFSMEPCEMANLVTETQNAWQALGEISYGTTIAEDKSKEHRRSIYVCEDMQAGEEITSNNIRIIRPGFGIAPKHYEQLIGMKVTKDICKGTPFSWEYVK
mgnify:FL=1